ncbi:MAG TPA: hypothetical protein VHW65_10525, partial [Gemmatimonadales bacterium]|nr:hypothetical protein [Gemmatimonadales bacterium]
MFALVAALQISAALPVDERGHLLPQDNVAAAPARIAAACPREHGELRDALLRDEARLAQRLAGTARQPDTAWLQLACLRATLFVDGATGREGLLMPLGTGWSHGAIEVLLRAIAQTPQGPTAARLLTAVALAAQQTSLPAVATFSENARGSREPLAPIANAVFAAVRAGVVDSAVYRGCTSYLLDIGDFAAARTCSSRALEHGADSTWHMLRLAYIAFHVADTLGGTRFFRDA